MEATIPELMEVVKKSSPLVQAAIHFVGMIPSVRFFKRGKGTYEEKLLWEISYNGRLYVLRHKGHLVPGPDGRKQLFFQEAVDFVWNKIHNIEEFTGETSFEVTMD